MPITQTRMLALIDAATVWQASYEALNTATKMHINELLNRARGSGASPDDCATIANKLQIMVHLNEPNYHSVRIIDLERGHFSPIKINSNISAARKQRAKLRHEDEL